MTPSTNTNVLAKETRQSFLFLQVSKVDNTRNMGLNYFKKDSKVVETIDDEEETREEERIENGEWRIKNK
jgi:hypothetical protein